MSYAFRGGAAVLAALLGIGGPVFAGATYFKERAARERETEVAGLADASRVPQGERSFLEGTISRQVPELKHAFVAYIERQHARNSSRIIDAKTQPLRIDAANGAIDIVNDDYAFDPWISRWGHRMCEISPPGWAAGSITAEGLLSGHPILAVGSVDAGGGFVAETIAAGPRAAYLDRLRSQSEWQIAVYWLVLAPFLLAYAAWQLQKVLREP